MGIFLLPILFSFALSILISFYYLSSLVKKRNNGTQHLKTPPGSTGWPIIGETLEYFSVGRKGVPEKFIFDRMKKYSSTIFKTSLFGQPFAFLCGPEANKFIFTNEDKLVTSWFPRSTIRLFNTPEFAKAARNLYLPFFSMDSLQKYVPIMDSATQQHLQKHWEGKDVVMVHAWAKLYATTIASRMLFGIEDEKTVMKLHKPLIELMAGQSSLPLNVPGTKFHRALKARAQLLKDLISMRQKWTDFLEGKLPVSQSSLTTIQEITFEEDPIPKLLLSLLASSYNPISTILPCLIMLLGQHPRVYNKVLAEQREISRLKARGETLNWEDIQKMKYSWSVACETFRLHGAIGFKVAISDFTFDGFHVPKGWKLQSSLYSTHKNPKYFKDPEKFDPSRFEGDGPLPYTFAPFGGGPCMCPGREYGRINILVFMHHLVTKFKWNQIFADEKIVTDPVPRPAKGLPIRLYPHEF